MPVVYWLIAAGVFLVIEIVTFSLASIWFVGGALAAGLMAYLGMPIWVQVIAFIAVTALMLAIIAPIARANLIHKKHDTNIDSLPGEVCLVTQQIDNLKGTGQVNLKGQVWTARSISDDLTIQEGTKVVVKEISGVKLIVVPAENGGMYYD